MSPGDEGLDEGPLLVGEVHDVIQNLYPLLSMSGQTMGIYAPHYVSRSKCGINWG